MFRKMPFILLAEIVLIGLIHQWIPLFYKSLFYGISLSIKSGIVFVLPIIIFGLLFKTAVQLSQKASKTILIILGSICVSNFISTMLSYQVGTLAYQFDLSMVFPSAELQLQPLWVVIAPKWIGNGTAMLAGLLLGSGLGAWKPALAHTFSLHIERIVGKLLGSFLYVIPLFIAGFVIQMNHDQVMGHIIHSYGLIFALIAVAVFTYICFLYFIANRGGGTSFAQSFKNMMPAAIAGFGSMSSAAAMPLTILGTEKNAKNPELAKSIIPATVNIHLIGDCFAIPIFAFAVLKSFGIAEPSFTSYLLFASYFVMAKFSVAAVPGGGILVMLPILEAYLGFDATMLSLITALYILFDPVITCANVLGNGGFALIVSRMVEKKGKAVGGLV
jgi:Na+/H+-dicarboxylate symporter